MRRWIAICLLALLPFQFVWAGAAGFCAHQGHVAEHAIESPATDAAGLAEVQEPLSHTECDRCPCHAVGLIGDVMAGEPPAQTTPTFAAWLPPVADSVRARPERPQWAPLA